MGTGEKWDMPDVGPPSAPSGEVVFPHGAYRANLYIYGPRDRIDWVAIGPDRFKEGRYFTIGRSADCSIRLDDGSASGHHAYIAAEGDALIVRDLESTNGTFVNESQITETTLHHGDVVRIGVTELRFLFSYQDPPAQVVLQFTDGPNAGKSIPTYGASITIGRMNCQVNLQGPGVAPQHVRIDAYGRSLGFVSPLRKDARTLINGARVDGIAAAKDGDRLTVGDHEMCIRILDDPAVLEQIPKGDGTLVVSDLDSLLGAAPVVQMRALDSAEIAGDRTVLDSSGGLQIPEDLPAGAETVEDEANAEHPPVPKHPKDRLERRSTGALPKQQKRKSEPKRRRREEPLEFSDEAPDELEIAPSAARRWLPVFGVVGAILGALLVLSLVTVPDPLYLAGELAPADESPLVAPVSGRIDKLYVRAGDRVVAGDLVAVFIDEETQQALREITREIEALEDAEPAYEERTVKRRAPPRLLQQLGQERESLRGAQAHTREVLNRFQRRDASFDDLERARSVEANLRRKVARLEAAVADARRPVTERVQVDSAMNRRAGLVDQQQTLELKLRVPLKAPRDGVLLTVEGASRPAREGAVSKSGESLFRIAELSRLTARMSVAGADLGAIEVAEEARISVEGYPEESVSVPLGRPAAAKDADGNFPVEAALPNDAGRFRPGLAVTARVERPDISMLTWLGRRAKSRLGM
jgi:pSer/pThr/pTyr-binding forkhead associated (FHA) protein/multidrug efflux pump subunit AcrA (membrane-fusion protein)